MKDFQIARAENQLRVAVRVQSIERLHGLGSGERTLAERPKEKERERRVCRTAS